MDNVAAVILSAGKGTRMKSGLAKVLHPTAGRPMAAWPVDAARGAGATPIVLVIGHQAEAVAAHIAQPEKELLDLADIDRLVLTGADREDEIVLHNQPVFGKRFAVFDKALDKLASGQVTNRDTG